jgi:hypothetical protein
VTPEEIGEVDVVLGNPPFVRYQTFSGTMRRRALRRAEDAGVVLSQMSNAWAPFVVHAMSFVKPGGRLGLILPAELLHAQFAAPVLDHILSKSKRVTILTFAAPLFPSLDVRTIVLIADGLGSRCNDFRITLIDNSNRETRWASVREWAGHDSIGVDEAHCASRVPDYYLPPQIRSIYRQVESSGMTRPMGDLTSVDIGYVTGDHDYFHFTRQALRTWKIPKQYRVPTLRSARNVKGCIFSKRDWERLARTMSACYLFCVPPDCRDRDLRSIRPYLAEGIRRGVDRTYQCRTRDPWFSIRGVRVADGLLTSTSSGIPRFILNEAGVAASNNVHIVNRRVGVDGNTLRATAASWYSSFTTISTIVEGHILGGGLRKLEPSEAERVRIVMPPDSGSRNKLLDLLPKIDSLLRGPRTRELSDEVDRLLLNETLGLDMKEVEVLRDFAWAHAGIP